MDSETQIALVMFGWVLIAFFWGVFIGRHTGNR